MIDRLLRGFAQRRVTPAVPGLALKLRTAGASRYPRFAPGFYFQLLLTVRTVIGGR